VEGNRNTGIREEAPRSRAEPVEDTERLADHLRHLARIVPAVSHDLRAHLNSMVLNLELLQRSLDGGATPGDRIARRATVIAGEIRQLDRMLKAVAGQTRLAGPQEERFDYRLLCEDLAILFRSYGRQRRIRVEAELPEMPVMVASDRDAIHHALTSLLIAVIDALPEGAQLSLAMRADRRNAVLTASATAPDSDSRAAESGAAAPSPVSFSREPAARAVAMARETLESLAAPLLISSGPRQPARLEIHLPLARSEH